MPFTTSPSRDKDQLTSFFENNIKRPIENSSLQYSYDVHRSGDAFNITDRIIKDLYDADVVVADLSGRRPNPNVMYELGVRLSISDKPVILIREADAQNLDVFDISSFYIFSYDPLRYSKLETHLIDKLARFESGEEVYRSPVREVLGSRLATEQSAQDLLEPDEQRALALEGIIRVGETVGEALGPRGKVIRRQRTSGEVNRARRGIAITQALESSQAAVQAGINFCRQLAEEVDQAVGDGTKICLGFLTVLIREGERLVQAGEDWATVIAAIEASADAALEALAGKSWDASTEDIAGVVGTAAGSSEIGFEIVRLMKSVGADGLITLEVGDGRTDDTAIRDGYQLRAGYVSEHLLADRDRGAWERGPARVLLYQHKINSVREVTPVLEKFGLAAMMPLVLLVRGVEQEVLSTIEVNNSKGKTDVMVVRAPDVSRHLASAFEDLAVYTGGSVISEGRGLRLENATDSSLGYVERVTVDKASTLFKGGAGDKAVVSAYVDRLRSTGEEVVDYEMELVRERMAMLIGRIGTVMVGGATFDDRRRRLDAWRSAIRVAYVASTTPAILGSGKPLAMVASSSRGVRVDMTPRDGSEVFALACLEPLRILALNVSQDPTQVLDVALETGDEAVSLDGATGELSDLRKKGVLDSLAVWDRAIKVAVSGARTFFETSRWIS